MLYFIIVWWMIGLLTLVVCCTLHNVVCPDDKVGFSLIDMITYVIIVNAWPVIYYLQYKKYVREIECP